MNDDTLLEMDIEKRDSGYNSPEHDMLDEEIVREKEIEHEEEEFTLTEKHEEPKKGMSFDSIEALMDYYKGYGTQVGFTISKRTSSKGNNDDVTRYVTIACSRSGKSKRNSKNILRPQPISKTNCQAKVNAVLHDEGKWLVTGVVLDHNHSLSPRKIPLHRSIRRIQPHVKRQLLLYSNAGIRVNQSMSAIAVEANGHENLSFIEKDVRNFIEKQKRLKLGNGDVEALQNYFMKVQATDSNFRITQNFFIVSAKKNRNIILERIMGRIRVYWDIRNEKCKMEPTS